MVVEKEIKSTVLDMLILGNLKPPYRDVWRVVDTYIWNLEESEQRENWEIIVCAFYLSPYE